METTLTAPKIRSNSALGAASPHARLKDGVPTPVISPLSRARENSGLALSLIRAFLLHKLYRLVPLSVVAPE